MLNNLFQHKILNTDDNVNILGLNKKVQASYVWNLFCVSKKNILIVTNTLYDANKLFKDLNCFSSNILFFPMDDFLVSEALAISPDLMSKRIETLNELAYCTEKKYIIITNLMGYLRFLPSKELWKKSNIVINKNQSINRDKLIDMLFTIGYKKENIVTKTGEFVNRGYILDVFPYGYEHPVRIEFFDDEVDEIRLFNIDNQLSIKKLDSIEIYPFTEFINEKSLYDIPNRQSLLPRVVKKVSCLSNYINDSLIIFNDIDYLNKSYINIMEEVAEYKETDSYDIEKYMMNFNELIPKKYINISSVDNYEISNISESYSIKEIEEFNGNFEKINLFIKKMINDNKKVIVCLRNKDMINDFCNNIKLNYILTSFDNLLESYVNIIEYNMPNGYIINNYVFLSSTEIYNKNDTIKYKNKFKYGTKIKDINKLNVGDYIVHSIFGIGRYLGIKTLTKNGLKKDYLYLEYKDKDKLYVPVENIEYISKYSSNEGLIAKLSKLGGTDWIKQKARVRNKVKDIAKDLLENSAKRKLLKGFIFEKDDEEQYLFEQNFAYNETADQLKAIKEIKKDMCSDLTMDRLLCGDVGYGKTEVAFRAIFKAIKSGKQVAFLCPTTILSKQHYENAIDRFNGFGVNIEVLNRFVTPKKKNEILENLKNGKIDLIIGTHRLLSKDIIYKDLGLLVIDEEQRFGVTHKEKIKDLKQNIDVLTLSATPIPRTLQMSLSGIRGLSLIETPPAFRYPIQTYVLKENNQIIKDAIYKEMSRNGQIFILYNNVAKMEWQLDRIKNLVPEAKINYINGQMNKNDIEKIMEAFIQKEFDILLCTTIIETGIDIENVNTLIIFDADHFGLSQLYQIRGRIGRSTKIAYAYLMYNPKKELNDIAVKRLNAIKEFTELGSGYALAMRDLSIRGAGNILGAEQSGFIDTIGYDLYLKLLNEEVEKLKNNVTENTVENTNVEKPFIQVDTHISDIYADNEEMKIEIHKKINSINSTEKFEAVKNELEDRFGKLDENTIIYMLEELFQSKCKTVGILKVEQLPREIILYINKDKTSQINGLTLLSKLFKITPNFSVNYVNSILKIKLSLSGLEKHFLYYLIDMLEVIE